MASESGDGDVRDDRALLADWCAGDQEAFAILVRRHLGVVLAACRRRLGAADADDVAQAVFLVLARRGRSLLGDPRPLAPWLHGVACQVARNAERARASRLRHEAEAARQMTSIDPGDRTWAEAAGHLDGCLDELPVHERDALVLHYLAGRDRTACAAALGIGGEALKKRLQRGLERLRTGLQRRGVAVASSVLLASLLERHAGAVEPSAALIAATAVPVAAPAAGIAVGGGILAALLAVGVTALGIVAWPAADAPPAPPVGAPALQWDAQPRDAMRFGTLVDWIFTPDAGQDPGLIPVRVVEVALVRVGIAPARVAAPVVEAVWDSRAVGWGGTVILTREKLSAWSGGPARTVETSVSGDAAVLRVVAGPEDGSLSARCERIGLPLVDWPLPAAGTLPATVVVPSPGQTVRWSPGAVGEGPLLAVAWTAGSWQQAGVGMVSGRVLGMDLAADFGGSATGTVAGRMRWRSPGGDGHGFPAWSVVQADLRLVVQLDLVQPVKGRRHTISGRLRFSRHAWALSGAPTTSATLDSAVTILARTPAVLDGEPRTWTDLAGSGDPDVATAARGLVLLAGHPPRIGGAEAVPAPASATAAPDSGF